MPRQDTEVTGQGIVEERGRFCDISIAAAGSWLKDPEEIKVLYINKWKTHAVWGLHQIYPFITPLKFDTCAHLAEPTL